MKYKKRIFGLLLAFGLAVALCIVGAAGAPVPSWVRWSEKEVDGFVLRRKRLQLLDEGGSLLWESDKAYKVQDFLVADLDRNGDQELIVLLWKRGKYGSSRPFWVTEDETDYSQHVFLYDIEEGGKLRSKWFTSDVGTPITRMKMLENVPDVLLTETLDGVCDLWRWNTWGLEHVDNEVKIVAFGDNIIHDEIRQQADRMYGGRYDFLYEPFLEDIQDADIATLQLESILVDKDSAVAGYPDFGSPLAVGEAIRDAGFDVVVGAGNHALDRGIYGIDVTSYFFDDAGILCVGIQSGSDTVYRPYEIIERKGMRIALFAYTYGTNGKDVADQYPYAVHYLPSTEDEERALVAELQGRSADFVVVFVHWGDEYSTEVSEQQRHMAQLFSEGGADLVIGTHPHVVQEVEMLDHTLVFYSLGNFRAFQGQMEETKTGLESRVTLEHTYDGVKIKCYSSRPVDAYVSSYGK